MSRRRSIPCALAAVTLLAARAAQAQTPPPPPATPPLDCRANPKDPRCAPAKAASGGGNVGSLNGGSCGGGGGNDGVALLFAAVVGTALLPLVIYIVDDPATPEARARWSGPSARVFVFGGATTQLHAPHLGYGGVRVMAGYGYVGVDGSAESALHPFDDSEADGTVVFRPPPTQHVELGIALGARYLQVQGAQMGGFEVAVPHRYLFGSLFNQRVALDLRPAVTTNGNDLALTLEAGLQIPLPGPLAARLSGRIWSFNHEIETSALGGLELAL